MARQQELKTTIVLSGNVDNSFGVIGRNLLALGSQVDTLSSKLIDFGSKSLKDYINYDDIIREVQALGEYDRQTIQILTEYNKGISRTSKYTMQQSAQAEVLMGQLGMDIKETKQLMPAVMNLATASKIEMAESLNYLYYSLNSLDKPITYADTLADQMAKTAAVSAADIDTLGESLQRLGSNAKFFTGGSSEILAILGGISQFGEDMQGSEAGTQLRNFMLTLLAPTQSKQKLLDSLSVTEEQYAEFESYVADMGIDLTNTAEAMDELGFSVYDQHGQLKSAIEIIAELDSSLSGLSEAERNTMLGQLFGKRTTTTALNLMSALGTINKYQDLIANHSAGYAEAMAETMEGGLGGAARHFKAAAGVLSYTVGEQLAPTAEKILSTATNVINTLSDTDAQQLAPIVKGLTALALTGPMIKLAGGAFMLLGRIFQPGGAIAFGIPLLLSSIAYLKELNQQDMESNFGDMALDMTELTAHVNTLGSEFETAYSEVNTFSDAVDTAAETYKTASSELSGKLLTAMLTGSTLSEADKEILYGLGDEMHSALIEGITNSTASSMSYWEMLFGGAGVAEYDEDYRDIISTTNSAYLAALNTAEGISQEFRTALNSAFEDHQLTDEEYDNIAALMDEYNTAMAEAAAEAKNKQDFIEYQKMLASAQTASLDDLDEYSTIIKNARDEQLTLAKDAFDTEYYGLLYDGYDPNDKADAGVLAMSRYKYAEHEASIRAKYDRDLYGLWDAALKGSGLNDVYEMAKGWLGDEYAYLGTERIHDYFKDAYGGNTYANEADSILNGQNRSTQLNELLNGMIDAYGGIDGIMTAISEYEKIGDTDTARMLNEMLAVYAVVANSHVMDFATGMPEADKTLRDYVDNLLESGYFGTGNGKSLIYDTYEGSVLAPQIAANDAAMNYMPVFDTGIIGEAREMGEQARAAAYEGWGDVELRARITYTGSSAANGFALYADGGRATEASIFGEAGPEWAIPEAHTQRVAQLLDAARAGAGFTWPELIARNGGLNAGGGGAEQLIYMPTIIANDATGVEEKLKEDKDRLDKWYSEKKLRGRMEVYA